MNKLLAPAGLFLLCLLLTFLVPAINSNTLVSDGLNDNGRYFSMITSFEDIRPGLYLLLPLTWFGPEFFLMAMNFIFYISIGAIFLGFTKDRTMTLVALLCFSTTLVTTFSLYAQGLIIIMALIYWLKVPFSWNNSSLKELAKWAAFGLFCFAIHRFGIFIFMTVFAAKVIPHRLPNWAVAISYGLIWVLLFFGGVNSGMRLGFFYPTLLPIDLGTLNTALWAVFLSLPIFYTFIKTTKSDNAKRFVFFTYIGTFVFYIFVTHLEIDIWRMMILADLIMLLDIAKSRADILPDPEDREPLLDWVPVFLLLFGFARIILGMKIF